MNWYSSITLRSLCFTYCVISYLTMMCSNAALYEWTGIHQLHWDLCASPIVLFHIWHWCALMQRYMNDLVYINYINYTAISVLHLLCYFIFDNDDRRRKRSVNNCAKIWLHHWFWYLFISSIVLFYFVSGALHWGDAFNGCQANIKIIFFSKYQSYL